MSKPTTKTLVRVTNRYSQDKTYSVKPSLPQNPIHIYRGSHGYKLSVGDRHLNLAELAAIVQLANRRIARS